MSKRSSGIASNTLFNYFIKTPPANKKPKENNSDELPNGSVQAHNNKCEGKKRERRTTVSPVKQKQDDSEDESPIIAKRKKIRLQLDSGESEDSDSENKADNVIPKIEESITIGKKLQENFKYDTSPSPKSRQHTIAAVKGSSHKNKAADLDTTEKVSCNISEDGNWVHCKLDWLQPDKIRDVKKRRPDHPEYDPKTLYVPPDFLKDQTPAHRQWWEMKSAHYDCVLFFKVGKFYELYHMDATVGVNELGFSYMKGEFAHSGFPESAYARMASTLVSKGYKVARVEQTETPDMMQERCKKTGQNSKFDKVVRREICQVTCKGTEVCGLQEPGPSEPGTSYMMSIAEEERNGFSIYGVCFVDTSIGLIHMSQFEDDKHSSRLLTTLAHYPPVLITYDRKTTTPRTNKLLSTHCYNARREPLSFSPPEKTLKMLAEKYYKTDSDGDWPEGLKSFLHDGDTLGLTPAENCYLAVKALGGCVAYLTECLLDIQILGMSQFTAYNPPDILNKTLTPEKKVDCKWKGDNMMILDAITLRNLRIIQDEGCLYDRLNFCVTAMGKRELYQWVCAPSCNVRTIKERQEAVKYLFEHQDVCQDAKNVLITLPDLERLLTKIHTLGNLKRSKLHPDARAIFYEEQTYSKRKVVDFLAVLNGFNAALQLSDLFCMAESKLLRRITQFDPEGTFPDYRDSLTFFKESFDHDEAQKAGRILPAQGVDHEYDSTMQLIMDIEQQLEEYLTEQEKYFKCKLHYVGTDKKRYQIEVPQSAAQKADSEYHLEGARKGFKRYSTAETKDLLAQMMAAEEQKKNVLTDLSRRIFEKFSSEYHRWATALRCIAKLDVLMALAEFARQQHGDVCLPNFSSAVEKPFISIVEGRHPCIATPEFIPNDTTLGGQQPALLLLTGPNMGGKSTLMRQVGLITVLAHLGSFVPASECSLSVVDRIFTRLGASDDILAGQSTFLVEMNETAAIVRHATLHSLVLLDELGRGTSTYDGTAIASGVCAELAARACRTIFSTHYHSLVRHFADHPTLIQGHMACMVETDESAPDNEDNIPEETITFLYKLTPGACPKSYGFNAARLAGVPRHIISRAHKISRDLEKEATCIRAFKETIKADSAKNIRELLSALSV